MDVENRFYSFEAAQIASTARDYWILLYNDVKVEFKTEGYPHGTG